MEAPMTLQELLAPSAPDSAALASYLDGLSHRERLHAVRSLPRRLMARLYDVADRGTPLTLEDFAPSALDPLVPVRHHGINSLPLFRIFAKPMYRLSDGSVAGRNEQFWSWLVGPGYFTLREDSTAGKPGITLDYVALPQERPAGWPNTKSNAAGFSYFVFRGLNDVMRGVSSHVTIGKALRDGKDIGQYFILVREDPQAALSGAEPKALAAPSS